MADDHLFLRNPSAAQILPLRSPRGARGSRERLPVSDRGAAKRSVSATTDQRARSVGQDSAPDAGLAKNQVPTDLVHDVSLQVEMLDRESVMRDMSVG